MRVNGRLVWRGGATPGGDALHVSTSVCVHTGRRRESPHTGHTGHTRCGLVGTVLSLAVPEGYNARRVKCGRNDAVSTHQERDVT